MSTIVTKILTKWREYQATDMLADIAGESGDQIYLGIGHGYQWTANDTFVPQYVTCPVNNFQTFRDLVAYKDLKISDGCVVVPRSDWSNGTTYVSYTGTFDLYTYDSVKNANGTVTFSNTTVVGNNTTFLLDFANNEILQVPGDGNIVLPQRFEVISVQSNTQMQINTSPPVTITANVPQEITNTFPNYASNFYVRNTYDQVFICLGNNNNTASNTMPAISLGGQLPNSQYIITQDGYFWKYLYTIPSGLKQLFFNQQWMPVVIESQVANSAVNGRIDVVKIINGGTGYNNTAASFSAPILTVVGDGTSANITAIVSSAGTITGVNILNAGNNYTTANIVVSPGATGVGANLQVVIGPSGGWGANAYTDLGARTVMVSPTLSNTENGTIPESDSLGNFFNYRQIVLVRNPTLANNPTLVANSTNYDLTTTIPVAANTPIAMNDLVYQSPTGQFANATFTANCVWFDNGTNILHINNLSGNFIPQSTIYATKNTSATPYASVQAFNAVAPLIFPFSGQLLYVENRSPVQRAPNQTENIKLIITF